MPTMNFKTLKKQSYLKFPNLYLTQLAFFPISFRLTLNFVEEWLPFCINENVDSFWEMWVHCQVKCQHSVKPGKRSPAGRGNAVIVSREVYVDYVLSGKFSNILFFRVQNI